MFKLKIMQMNKNLFQTNKKRLLATNIEVVQLLLNFKIDCVFHGDNWIYDYRSNRF